MTDRSCGPSLGVTQGSDSMQRATSAGRTSLLVPCEGLGLDPARPPATRQFATASGKLRDELLNGEILTTLQEAEVVVEQWRRHYNTKRPQSSLERRPPRPETILPRPASLAPLRPVLVPPLTAVTSMLRSQNAAISASSLGEGFWCSARRVSSRQGLPGRRLPGGASPGRGDGGHRSQADLSGSSFLGDPQKLREEE